MKESGVVLTESSNQPTGRTSRHLTVGLVTLGVAVIYVTRVFLVPWPPACLLMPVTLVALVHSGGFLHYTLVIGPPSSRPHPSLSDRNNGNSLIRWTDGVYDWIR